jgi:signal transduction histidine kinase
MDSIHFWTTNFIRYEQSVLKERSEDLEQQYFLNDVIRFSSFALIGIISILALITIANKENDNKRLLVELQQFNQQLEYKVKDRTRRLEEANNDLIRLNDEKNHFLGITTHDLKAPLAGISGLLELMRLEKVSLSERHLGYIKLMEETCQDMLRLISDLLDLSRIEQGTSNMTIREISISKVISQLEDHFRSWALRKNIKLVFESPTSSKAIFSDPDILVRILDNLISNAIKFSPKGKQVTISIVKEETYVRFSVSDQGPGIKESERDKLFMRFQKLSARPTDGESSSGLGLSIVKDLVDLLKGTIKVESDPVNGTHFIVQLPYAM